MTTRTRLASSKHLVRVEKVLREAPIVRPAGSGAAGSVEGVISGIIMEFCDMGELTSYLWDQQLHAPRALDEFTARYLFGQTMQLLVELFAPSPIVPQLDGSHHFDKVFDSRDAVGVTWDSQDAADLSGFSWSL